MNDHCQKCGSDRLHRSRRRDKTEIGLALIGGRFRRCHQCQSRFLVWGTVLVGAGRLDRYTKEIAMVAIMAAGLLLVLCIPLLTNIQ